MTRSRSKQKRRGAIVPLTALLLVFLIGLIAFAVDTSWIVMTQSELQNSADAAALAGAQQLVKNYPLYALPGQSSDNKNALASAATANARSVAKTYGTANGAGGKATLTYLDADVQVGFTDAAGTFTEYASGGNYPNTVKVRARRDNSANNPLKLFFGAVLGTSSVPLTAPATAMLYTANVNSFNAPPSGNLNMLPITYDVNDWKNFIETGKDSRGQKSYDSNNNPELQVYDSFRDTGNFGQLSLNDSNIGTSVIKSWVTDGVGAADIGSLTSSGLLPLSSHSPTSWDWQGSTGFSASLVQTVNDQIGKTYWLPLYKPFVADSSSPTYSAGVGTGSNYSFNIVAFVPVKIVPSQNKNRQVTVQAVSIIDSSAAFDVNSVKPAGTATNTYFTTVLAPRLSN